MCINISEFQDISVVEFQFDETEYGRVVVMIVQVTLFFRYLALEQLTIPIK